MIRFALTLAAILLCGISIFCSVVLWYNEMPNSLAAVIFGIAACGVELCKFVFIPVASKRNGLSTVPLVLTGCLLLVFSVFSTVSFLEATASESISDARNHSYDYQSKLKTIQSIELEIQLNIQAKQKAVEFNFRKEARGYDETLANLRHQLAKYRQQLGQIKIVSQRGTLSIFDSVSDSFQLPPKETRLVVYTIIAILIDVCGILCLIVLTGVRETKKPAMEGDVTNVTKNATNETKKETKKCNEKPATKKPCNEAQILKREIARGKYGMQPTMKACITGTLRHKIVSRIFSELISEGVMWREGRKYHLKKANVVPLR